MKEFALTWAQRAQSEIGAAKRFENFIHLFNKCEAPQTVIDMAKKAYDDEIRHAYMCASVARNLGHDSGFASMTETPHGVSKEWLKGDTLKNQLLCEVVLMGCITESVNASLMQTLYLNAKDSPVKNVIQSILKDEIKHAQLGWAYLAHETEQRDCSFIGNYLENMLSIAVRDELLAPPVEFESTNKDFEYGVLPVAERSDQFIETLFSVIKPGFEKYGISTVGIEKWSNTKALLESRNH